MIARAPDGLVGCRGAASWEEVSAQLADGAFFPPASSYALLRRADDIQLVLLDEALGAGLLAVAWSGGQVFNAQRTIEWEQRAGGYALRLLTEGALPADWEACSRYEVGAEVKLLLFGERRPEQAAWREARVPRDLRYPVSAAGVAWLLAVPYRRDGMTVRYRWKRVGSDGPAAE